jgi:transglutaminase-like putative cysteine protease
LTAALRAAGIPAAVGFADVRNHLNSPKLADLMGTDLFIYHGYVALWLDGNLFKVTPAFNTELCERFGVRQLIFDGKSDALFHEFDTNSQRHMEYVRDRGWFADPPIGQLLREFRVTYPKLWQSSIHRISVSDPAFSGER